MRAQLAASPAKPALASRVSEDTSGLLQPHGLPRASALAPVLQREGRFLQEVPERGGTTEMIPTGKSGDVVKATTADHTCVFL